VCDGGGGRFVDQPPRAEAVERESRIERMWFVPGDGVGEDVP
jgi:hypothetical protein